MKSEERGLGDKIEKITKATGVEKVVKAIFGEDCGCDKRRDLLNKMFPNTKVKTMDKDQRTFFEDVIQKSYKRGQSLRKENADKFYQMFEDLTGSKATRTSCASCNKKTYEKLLKIYEASCDE